MNILGTQYTQCFRCVNTGSEGPFSFMSVFHVNTSLLKVKSVLSLSLKAFNSL